jgi:MFS family permease
VLNRQGAEATTDNERKPVDNVKALGYVSLANDVSSDMLIPLLPTFVTTVLGLGPAFLGVLEGIAESTASLLKLVSGWYSDRVKKRKALAVFGYGVSNLLRPLIGLATAGWHVLFFRFMDRVGKGVRTSPRDALLSASVEKGQMGRAFGFQRAMDNLGATIGPLLASLLLWLSHDNLRLVFLLSFIPGVVAVWFLITRVKEVPVAAPAEAAPSAPKASPLAGGIPTGVFRAYLASVIVFTLGNSSDVFLVLRAQNLGVTVALIPILWVVLNLVKTLAATPGGALSDRIGRRQAILIGWLIYGLAYLGFAFASKPWHIWALFIFYGLYYGMVEGPERALVADLVPEDQRGRAYGWFHLAVGVGALPASLLFGVIWKYLGASAAFVCGALFALAAAWMLRRALGDRPAAAPLG